MGEEFGYDAIGMLMVKLDEYTEVVEGQSQMMKDNADGLERYSKSIDRAATAYKTAMDKFINQEFRSAGMRPTAGKKLAQEGKLGGTVSPQTQKRLEKVMELEARMLNKVNEELMKKQSLIRDELAKKQIEHAQKSSKIGKEVVAEYEKNNKRYQASLEATLKTQEVIAKKEQQLATAKGKLTKKKLKSELKQQKEFLEKHEQNVIESASRARKAETRIAEMNGVKTLGEVDKGNTRQNFLKDVKKRMAEATMVIGSLTMLHRTLKAKTDILGMIEDEVYALGITAGMTVGEIHKLREETLQFATDYRYTTAQILRAQDLVAKTGRTLAESQQVVTQAVDLATASFESLDFATSTINKGLVAFEIQTYETKAAVDTLFSAVLNTPLSLRMMDEALRQSASSFSSLLEMTNKSGAELEDYKMNLFQINAALTGGMAMIGKTGSQAGTSIKMMNSKLIALEKTAKNLFDTEMMKNGITIGDDLLTSDKLSEMAQKDYTEVLDLLSELYTKGQLSYQTLSKMFGVRHSPQISAILAQINGDLDQYVEKMAKGRDASESAQIAMTSWTSSLKKFRNSWDAVEGSFSDIMYTMLPLIDGFASLLQIISKGGNNDFVSAALSAGILAGSLKGLGKVVSSLSAHTSTAKGLTLFFRELGKQNGKVLTMTDTMTLLQNSMATTAGDLKMHQRLWGGLKGMMTKGNLALMAVIATYAILAKKYKDNLEALRQFSKSIEEHNKSIMKLSSETNQLEAAMKGIENTIKKIDDNALKKPWETMSIAISKTRTELGELRKMLLSVKDLANGDILGLGAFVSKEDMMKKQLEILTEKEQKNPLVGVEKYQKEILTKKLNGESYESVYGKGGLDKTTIDKLDDMRKRGDTKGAQRIFDEYEAKRDALEREFKEAKNSGQSYSTDLFGYMTSIGRQGELNAINATMMNAEKIIDPAKYNGGQGFWKKLGTNLVGNKSERESAHNMMYRETAERLYTADTIEVDKEQRSKLGFQLDSTVKLVEGYQDKLKNDLSAISLENIDDSKFSNWDDLYKTFSSRSETFTNAIESVKEYFGNDKGGFESWQKEFTHALNTKGSDFAMTNLASIYGNLSTKDELLKTRDETKAKYGLTNKEYNRIANIKQAKDSGKISNYTDEDKKILTEVANKMVEQMPAKLRALKMDGSSEAMKEYYRLVEDQGKIAQAIKDGTHYDIIDVLGKQLSVMGKVETDDQFKERLDKYVKTAVTSTDARYIQLDHESIKKFEIALKSATSPIEKLGLQMERDGFDFGMKKLDLQTKIASAVASESTQEEVDLRAQLRALETEHAQKQYDYAQKALDILIEQDKIMTDRQRKLRSTVLDGFATMFGDIPGMSQVTKDSLALDKKLGDQEMELAQLKTERTLVAEKLELEKQQMASLGESISAQDLFTIALLDAAEILNSLGGGSPTGQGAPAFDTEAIKEGVASRGEILAAQAGQLGGQNRLGSLNSQILEKELATEITRLQMSENTKLKGLEDKYKADLLQADIDNTGNTQVFAMAKKNLDAQYEIDKKSLVLEDRKELLKDLDSFMGVYEEGGFLISESPYIQAFRKALDDGAISMESLSDYTKEVAESIKDGEKSLTSSGFQAGIDKYLGVAKYQGAQLSGQHDLQTALSNVFYGNDLNGELAKAGLRKRQNEQMFDIQRNSLWKLSQDENYEMSADVRGAKNYKEMKEVLAAKSPKDLTDNERKLKRQMGDVEKEAVEKAVDDAVKNLDLFADALKKSGDAITQNIQDMINGYVSGNYNTTQINHGEMITTGLSTLFGGSTMGTLASSFVDTQAVQDSIGLGWNDSMLGEGEGQFASKSDYMKSESDKLKNSIGGAGKISKTEKVVAGLSVAVGAIDGMMKAETAQKLQQLDAQSQMLDMQMQMAHNEEDRERLAKKQLELEKQKVQLQYEQQTGFMGATGGTGGFLGGAVSGGMQGASMGAGLMAAGVATGGAALAIGAGMALMGGISGGMAGSAASKQKAEQEQQLENQYEMMEYDRYRNKLLERQNGLMEEFNANLTKFGSNAALNYAIQNNVESLEGVGQAYWNDRSWHGHKGGWEDHQALETETATLDEIGYDDEALEYIRNVDDLKRIQDDVKEQTDKLEDQYSKYEDMSWKSQTEGGIAHGVAEMNAWRNLEKQLEDAIKLAEETRYTMMGQYFGFESNPIYDEKDEDLVIGFELGNWEGSADILDSIVDSLGSDATEVGESIGSMLIGGIENVLVKENSVIQDLLYGKYDEDKTVVEGIEQELKKLFSEDGINALLFGDTSKVITESGETVDDILTSIIDKTGQIKDEQDKINDVMDEYLYQWIVMGGKFSDIVKEIDEELATLYDNLYNGLKSDSFEDMANNIGADMGTRIADSYIKKFLDETEHALKMVELEKQVTLAVETNDFADIQDASNAMMAMLTEWENERQRVDAMMSMFELDSQIEYNNEDSRVQYETGSTKEVVYNTTITNEFYTGNFIGDEESRQEFADSIADNMAIAFSDKGYNLSR